MPWLDTFCTSRHIAQLSLLGMGFDGLGGCYLAYDILGGKDGPLRMVTRSVSYVVIFFVGYVWLLGWRYAAIAGLGMGILLAAEYYARPADGSEPSKGVGVFFGVGRGVTIGLAATSIEGAKFGVFFGAVCALVLTLVNLAGFLPSNEFVSEKRPSLSKRKIIASCYRAIAVAVAAFGAGLYAFPEGPWFLVGLRLGVGAGMVSALAGLFSPIIEWKADHLQNRRLGALGLMMILCGMALQSLQYWVVVMAIQPRK